MSSETPFRLFNTLTGKVEPICPLDAGHLRMYGCGPTVYSYAHIGNFRSFLTSDLILRTAHAIGWKTTYVTNITDVGHLTTDDTIDPAGEDRMARALRSKEGERFVSVWDLARYYTGAFLGDWLDLNLAEPYVRPRATEHVREQIQTIEKLIAAGAAYETSIGIYFSVPAFAGYGKLSGNDAASQLRSAAREVVIDQEKRDPRDFALWKKDPHHLMQWHSPWGWGFPGWHIECSVMAQAYLGAEIDLHTGGEDLIFPHHECEIAQAESLTGKPFARHWVHTRFLQVEGQKMSKRLGNFLRVLDVLGHNPPNEKKLALRLALISGQYRKPFNFTGATLRDSLRHVQRFQLALHYAKEAKSNQRVGPDGLRGSLEGQYKKALGAMKDDLNTPAAIAAALGGTKTILAAGNSLSAAAAVSAQLFLTRINGLLGVVSYSSSPHVQEQRQTVAAGETSIYTGAPRVAEEIRVADDGLAATIERLIKERKQARARKDYARADAIRDEILSHSVELHDTPEGTTWRRKSTF